MKPSNERALIIGIDSNIGIYLSRYLISLGYTVLGSTRRRESISPNRIFLDLENLKDFESLSNFSLAFICAGVTSIQQCQNFPQQAHQINVIGTYNLIKELIWQGTFVTFLSTNLVFDGKIPYYKEEDPVCPNTIYGKLKSEVEKLILDSSSAAVVRLTKVLSLSSPIINKWMKSLKNNAIISPIYDYYAAPISADYTVRALTQIAEKKLTGILHLSGNKDTSYSDIAQELAKHITAPCSLIKPISIKESLISLDSVPLYTALSMQRLENELNLKPPTLSQTIKDIFEYE